MTLSDLIHIAFGAAAGLTLVAMLLLARQSVGARGPLPSLASLAGAILALLLLLAAAAQLEPVLLNLNIDPKEGLTLTKPIAKNPLPALLAFVSRIAFLGALLGGVTAGLLTWVTRDDPSEEAGEEDALLEELAEPAF